MRICRCEKRRTSGLLMLLVVEALAALAAGEPDACIGALTGGPPRTCMRAVRLRGPPCELHDMCAGDAQSWEHRYNSLSHRRFAAVG